MPTYTDEEIKNFAIELRDIVNECSNVTLVRDRKTIETHMQELAKMVDGKFRDMGVNASLDITKIDIAEPAVTCQIVPRDHDALRFLLKLEEIEGEPPLPDTWAALAEEIDSKE